MEPQNLKIARAFRRLPILIDFVIYFRPHGAPVKPPPVQDPLIFIKPSSTYLKHGGKIKVNNVKGHVSLKRANYLPLSDMKIMTTKPN